MADSTLSLFFSGLARALGSLPLPLRRLVGSGLGRVFSLVPTRDRRIASLQSRRVLGAAAPSMGRVYGHFGRTLCETANLTPILARRDELISCDGFDLAERAIAPGKGVLALTAHFGNWDLLAAYGTARGIPLVTVGRPVRNPHMQPALEDIRIRSGADVIWRNKPGDSRRILQTLKDGKVLAALIDQDTRVESVLVPFFGIPAKTPDALVRLAKRFGSAVICTFLTVRNDRYHVVVRRLDETRSVEEILEQYHQELENVIRAAPEQWVWFHKRWRSPTVDTTLSSREYVKALEDDGFFSGRSSPVRAQARG